MSEIDRTEGRRAFGGDAAGYDRARPAYPEAVYQILRDRCGLCAGTRAFEIGPGTGHVTRKLFEAGAGSVVAVEPDERMAAFLLTALAPFRDRLEVRVQPFEVTELADASFDLGIAATSFHWLEPGLSLRKVAAALRPAGWWAVWWNVFGDPERPDAFHESTRHLFREPDYRPPAGASWSQKYATDVDARLAELRSEGRFEEIRAEQIRWSLTLDARGVREMFATFSVVTRLPPDVRRTFLDRLERIADERFGGRVEKPMLTPVYIARRK